MTNEQESDATRDRAAWREHIDALLDEALKETFPASDPVAISVVAAPDLRSHPPAKALR